MAFQNRHGGTVLVASKNDGYASSCYGSDSIGPAVTSTTPDVGQRLGVIPGQTPSSAYCDFVRMHTNVESMETAEVSIGGSSPGCYSLSTRVDHDLCIALGKGSYLELEGCLQSLVADPSFRTYQLAGTTHSVSCATVLLTSRDRPTCAGEGRHVLVRTDNTLVVFHLAQDPAECCNSPAES